jgi:hypothetical protein
MVAEASLISKQFSSSQSLVFIAGMGDIESYKYFHLVNLQIGGFYNWLF